MNLDVSMQSLKNLFAFPFRDPKWQGKFLTGAGLLFAGSIIPLLPWLPVLGYAARLMRSGARNDDASRLPEWDDWSDLFTDGLRQFGVSLILTLPGTVLMLGGYVIYMLSLFSSIAASEGRGGRGGADFGMGMLISIIALFIGMGLGMLFSTVGMLLLPPAAGHVAVQRRFGAFFQPGQWWKVLRANLGGFLVTLFILFALYFVMMMAIQVLYMTIILCLLIPFAIAPLGFYVLVIYGRMIGQAYGEGAAKAGILPMPLPLVDPTAGADAVEPLAPSEPLASPPSVLPVEPFAP